MYGELIMDAVPEKVRGFVIMQMYLMRDWEGRVKRGIFQIQNWDLAQWCSEWFHYIFLLSAAQISFLSCAKIQFSVLLLLFLDLIGLALQVVFLVAWCYWCTCRRQMPCFHPSHSPFSIRSFCIQLICFFICALALQSGVSAEISDEDGFLLRWQTMNGSIWTMHMCCLRSPAHLAAVGAVAAHTVSAACLVNVNWCRAAWFLSTVDSAGLFGLCILNRMLSAFQLQCLTVGGSWKKERGKKKSGKHLPPSVTKFAAVAIIKSHLFISRAEQFSGETTKEKPNKAIFRWALQNVTLKIFKLRRKRVVALIGGDGDSSLVFSVLPECVLGLWYWRLYLFACVCFFFIVHNWNPHGRFCAGTSECGFEVCWHS